MPPKMLKYAQGWPPGAVAIAQIPALLAAAEASDHREALSEARRFELADPVSADVHSVSISDEHDTVIAYAQAGPVDRDGTRPLEVVVDPAHRDARTWEEILRTALDPRVGRGADHLAHTVWAHGEDPLRDAALASFAPALFRELWQVRIPLPRPDRFSFPADVAVRPFRPVIDNAAWLALNNAAFASHREQGRWSPADITTRIAQEWFDAAGFLMAWRGNDLIGFCWTKVHPATRFDPELGEIYVIATAPSAQGQGLGRALTLAGLDHLACRAVTTGMLYVDGDNIAARALYRSLGFVDHTVTRGWLVEPGLEPRP